jgi:hypothetical protein
VIVAVDSRRSFSRIPVLSRALLAVLLVTLVACGGDRTEPGMITRDQFIRVNVDLRILPKEAQDIEERRQQVLREHGLTQEQILDFIERTVRDLCKKSKIAGAYQLAGYGGRWLIPVSSLIAIRTTPADHGLLEELAAFAALNAQGAVSPTMKHVEDSNQQTQD